MNRPDVVIGGGLMGLMTAVELSDRGRNVVLFDSRSIGREASYASGGMLSPVLEARCSEPILRRLGLDSLEQWPDYARELNERSGMEIGYERTGSLLVAMDQDEVGPFVRRLGELRTMRLSEELEPVSGKQLPASLRSRARRAVQVPKEGRVDNRKLLTALYVIAKRSGVRFHPNDPVMQLTYEGDRIRLCRSANTTVLPDRVVVAAGAWSGSIPRLRSHDQPPLRPVRGQAVGLKPRGAFPEQVVRTLDYYFVPHPPDRLIAGATLEEKGFEPRVEAGGVMELLGEHERLFGRACDSQLLETWSGFRPATPDNRPIVGRSRLTENLYFVTGHYRHGVLLLPETRRLVRRMLEKESMFGVPDCLAPARFQPEEAGQRSAGERVVGT